MYQNVIQHQENPELLIAYSFIAAYRSSLYESLALSRHRLASATDSLHSSICASYITHKNVLFSPRHYASQRTKGYRYLTFCFNLCSRSTIRY